MSTIEFYANNRPLLNRYLEMNGITHFWVCNDYDRGYGKTWSVWEMKTETVGLSGEIFDRKYKAIAYANRLADITGLPVVK